MCEQRGRPKMLPRLLDILLLCDDREDEAVGETELVSASAEADVGIIPYDPSIHKFSQNLAAGLPILPI
jgi:hypothetical protein